MTIAEHLETFGGLPIRPAAGYRGGDPSGVAWKLDALEGDGEVAEQLTVLLDAAGAQSDRIEGLVIGAWTENAMEGGSDVAVGPLVAQAARLAGLRVLFVGEMTYEDCEISWIQHDADYGSLPARFPRLEWLGIRGANGLRLSGLTSASLVGLILESGGMPAELAADVCQARLPKLRHLELWVGTEDYGRTTDETTLAPLFAGGSFPALHTLGLRNAENTDALVGALVGSPLFGRIAVLDVSMGTLGDPGGQALLASPLLDRLEQLDVAHHHLSDPVASALQTRLGAKVVRIDEPSDDEEYVEVGE